VPSEEGLRLDEEPTATTGCEESAEASEKSAVGWLQCRALHLSTKHRDFVPQHDDLDRQVGLLAPAQTQELEDTHERYVQERERHGPSSLLPALVEKSR
jgi:hypothetical protein